MGSYVYGFAGLFGACGGFCRPGLGFGRGSEGTERQQANGKAREKTARYEKKRNGTEQNGTTRQTAREELHGTSTIRHGTTAQHDMVNNVK